LLDGIVARVPASVTGGSCRRLLRAQRRYEPDPNRAAACSDADVIVLVVVTIFRSSARATARRHSSYKADNALWSTPSWPR